MQQRRLRLGDILDDYCPRERRVTNHAVVAMIEEQVKQTRCVTCDAEHEYKQARVPVRRRKDAAAQAAEGGFDSTPRPSAPTTELHAESEAGDESLEGQPAESPEPEPVLEAAAPEGEAGEAAGDAEPAIDPEEEGPVHRRLIRATLPRPEGQAPEWKDPDFTVRQPGGGGGRGGFDGNRNGGPPQQQRPGPGRGRRRGRGPGGKPDGQPFFGGARQGGPMRHGSGQPPGQGGNRAGRQGPPGQGQGQSRGGQRPGGQGRKRGR